MKKSNFVAMILGTISMVFFALGMVSVLVPDFNAFNQGVVFGCIGLVVALVTLFVWRKMENKAPIKFTSKTVGSTLLAIIGTLGLGVGMSMTIAWNMMISGVFVGLVGIICLISLVPIIKGIK